MPEQSAAGSPLTATHRPAMTRRTPGARHRPRHPPVHRGGRARRGGHRGVCPYWHAYAVVRAHGETGITARLEPATIDGLVYASSMVVLYAARHRVPVPSLARWLLALGIAATLTANMAKAGPRSRRGGGRGLAGGQPRGLVRTSGLAHPHLRGGGPRTVGSAPLHWCGLLCCDASCPGLSR